MARAGLLVMGAALLGGLVPACGPEIPAEPTWAEDVYPIVRARCVRCHADPPRNDPNIAPRVTVNTLDYPDFTTLISVAGTTDYPEFLNLYVSIDTRSRMPPVPYAALDDWQLEIFARWSKSPR
jgi:hypothetical protein